jgi:hypothetical protein
MPKILSKCISPTQLEILKEILYLLDPSNIKPNTININKGITGYLPVFNTGTGFHHLKLGSNAGYTAINNVVEIYHWCISYQLHKP